MPPTKIKYKHNFEFLYYSNIAVKEIKIKISDILLLKTGLENVLTYDTYYLSKNYCQVRSIARKSWVLPAELVSTHGEKQGNMHPHISQFKRGWEI